jgi:hypothetical protein
MLISISALWRINLQLCAVAAIIVLDATASHLNDCGGQVPVAPPGIGGLCRTPTAGLHSWSFDPFVRRLVGCQCCCTQKAAIEIFCYKPVDKEFFKMHFHCIQNVLFIFFFAKFVNMALSQRALSRTLVRAAVTASPTHSSNSFLRREGSGGKGSHDVVSAICRPFGSTAVGSPPPFVPIKATCDIRLSTMQSELCTFTVALPAALYTVATTDFSERKLG